MNGDETETTGDDRETTGDDRETTGDAAPTIVLGGLLGGIVGAGLLGGLLWLVNPELLRASIPALYGFEPNDAIGWTVHLAHGAILGLVFAAIVSRPAVTGVLLADHDGLEIGPAGPATRITIAGVAYSLAVWALFPMIVMPVWLGAVGGEDLAAISAAPVESLIGHAVFGLALGATYAVIATRT